MPPPVIPYLESNFQRARPILFTGAGFSSGVTNVADTSLPSTGELLEKIWKLCFPDSPLDPGATLQTVFESAQLQCSNKLRELLVTQLTIEGTSVPKLVPNGV
jgi:hypothetical protein